MAWTCRLSATAISVLLGAQALWAQQLVITGKIGGDIRATAALLSQNGDTLVSSQLDRGQFTMSYPAAEAGMYRLRIGQWEKAYFMTPDTIRVSGYVDRQTGEGDVNLKGIDAHRRLLGMNARLSAAVQQYHRWVDDTVATVTADRKENAYIELAVKDDSVRATALIRLLDEERPEAPLAATVALLNAGSCYEDLRRVYDSLGAEAQVSLSGRQLAAKMAGLQQSAIGAVAPDFTVTDSQGNPVALSGLRGRTVLLDFWASWCGPCRKEMAYLKKLYADLKGQEVVFVSISLDDRRAAWEKAAVEEQIPWYSWWDERGFNDSQVRPLFGFNQIPFCVVLDREGRIVGKNLRRDELRRALDKALKTVKKK